MTDDPDRRSVASAMRAINQAWLGGRVDDLAPHVHPEIVMVLPGFSGQVRGHEPLLSGFRDFVQNASIENFRELDQQIDVVGVTAVVNFAYEMVYARAGERYRATGRDIWVFQREDTRWIAVWRTMLDLNETPA
jgi:hypothetical protein